MPARKPKIDVRPREIFPNKGKLIKTGIDPASE